MNKSTKDPFKVYINFFPNPYISQIDNLLPVLSERFNKFSQLIAYNLDARECLIELKLAFENIIEIFNKNFNYNEFYNAQYSPQRHFIEKVVELLKITVKIVDDLGNVELLDQRKDFILILERLLSYHFIKELQNRKEDIYFYFWARVNDLICQDNASNYHGENSLIDINVILNYYKENNIHLGKLLIKKAREIGYSNYSSNCLNLTNPLNEPNIRIAISLVEYLINNSQSKADDDIYQKLRVIGFNLE